jgi:putative ABC transport system ATP-binding protein
MISLKNIQKTYMTNAESISLFKNLDWDIPTGTWVALMGASGSGKSTLLSLIAGIILPDILSPDTSHIHIAGTDITTLSPDARTTYRGTHIAFIFQGFELIPTLTVSENIDIILDISHAPRRYTTQYILDRV